MSDENNFYHTLFLGLNELAASAFPKKCYTCGREFKNAEQFLRETEDLRESVSGLKQGINDDGSTIVEAFRNCPCGSTLMDFFNDRRDQTAEENTRRKKFGGLLNLLIDNGLEREVARGELKKVMRGDKSEIIGHIFPPQQK